MKHLMKVLFAVVVGLGLMTAAFADTVYPYQSPTYTPNMRTSAITMASGVAGGTTTLNNINTVGVQFDGTCPNLAAKLEGSSGTGWNTLTMYPNGAISTASAVTSATTTGAWYANTSGLNSVRINNTGASGIACTGTLAGSSGSFNLPH
jgi:hypothetical protein